MEHSRTQKENNICKTGISSSILIEKVPAISSISGSLVTSQERSPPFNGAVLASYSKVLCINLPILSIEAKICRSVLALQRLKSDWLIQDTRVLENALIKLRVKDHLTSIVKADVERICVIGSQTGPLPLVL